ncbi:MAG: zinc ribbon domain-containing protein, partial [Myxococcota bacterium]
ARGIFEQLSTQKLDYWGVRKVVVGAWYTSTICIKHSRVDKRMRKRQDLFECPVCGVGEHADEHAADVIANYLLLEPNVTKT